MIMRFLGRCAGALLTLSLSVLTSCSSSTSTSPSSGLALRSVRYVRTLPTTYASTSVTLNYTLPASHGLHHRRTGQVALRAIDATTFVYDSPDDLYVPTEADCTFWVVDPAVSPYYIATDIFVNDTRLRVDQDGNYAYGVMTVDGTGAVH